MSETLTSTSQTKSQYPSDIRALTSLRFAAALWVLVYFFGGKLGWHDASGFAAKGYLGVDLFFILSGFILAHVYGSRVETQGISKFAFGSFLWARLARIYPVHLVVLLSMVLLWGVATALGISIDDSFDPATLWAHLTLLHAWNTVPSGGWNHPSWSISAEWFAYLIFPIVGFVCAWLFKRNRLAPLLLLALFPLVWVFSKSMGFPNLTLLTGEGGFLRIIPSFFAGAAVWWVGRRLVLPQTVGLGIVSISVLWLVAATSLRAPDVVSWFGLAGIVFGLAETSKSSNAGFARGKLAIWLGEISYSLYMGHVLVDLVVSQVAKRVVTDPIQLGTLGPFVVLLGSLGSLVFAAILFHGVETPARNWLRTRDPFKL
jgi:peptidoglycan/LPS O-acetylase OafA/YrhL